LMASTKLGATHGSRCPQWYEPNRHGNTMLRGGIGQHLAISAQRPRTMVEGEFDYSNVTIV